MTEHDPWLRLAERDDWVRSEVPSGWYPDNADPSKLRYWNGRSWTNQVWDPATQEKRPDLPVDQVLPDAKKQKRLAEVEARLKQLDEQSREMTKEHIYLRESLEADFDPPQIRVENQERFFQLRQQQDAVRQEILELDEERKNLRPGWKNTLEKVGAVAGAAALIAVILIGGSG